MKIGVLALQGDRGTFATLFHRLTGREATRLDELLETIKLQDRQYTTCPPMRSRIS